MKHSATPTVLPPAPAVSPSTPPPNWMKEPVTVSLTGITKAQLDTWAARLTKTGEKPATRGDAVTEMVRVLLEAGWVPGVSVIVRNARRGR